MKRKWKSSSLIKLEAASCGAFQFLKCLPGICYTLSIVKYWWGRLKFSLSSLSNVRQHQPWLTNQSFHKPNSIIGGRVVFYMGVIMCCKYEMSTDRGSHSAGHTSRHQQPIFLAVKVAAASEEGPNHHLRHSVCVFASFLNVWTACEPSWASVASAEGQRKPTRYLSSRVIKKKHCSRPCMRPSLATAPGYTAVDAVAKTAKVF